MKKPKTKTQLKKLLDAAFSKYIRRKYLRNGYVSCYTCDKTMEFSKAQNGHFIPRGNMATRWDESNCRPQCPGCNIFGGGRYGIFAANLLEEMGSKKFNELIRKGKSIRQWTSKQLEEEIKKYL